jgi:hypothetical protein
VAPRQSFKLADVGQIYHGVTTRNGSETAFDVDANKTFLKARFFIIS